MHLSGSAQHRCNAYVNEIAASPASARNPPRRRWPKRGCPLCASQPYIATSEVLISIKVTGAVLAGCLLLTCPAAASNLTLRPQSLELSAPARGPGPAASRSPSVREQVAAISALTSKARAAADAGNFSEALADYTSITRGYPGLALTERARVKRALLLYETGQVQQAIVELDDEEIVLRGNAEVHAALATILYNERPDERQRAEAQWEVASEFDKRYGDVRWVAREKQWGPRMQQALQRFLALE